MNGDSDQDGDTSIKLGRQIRHWRLVKGLTLRDMAKLVGCSGSLLSKIENDRADALPEHIAQDRCRAGLECQRHIRVRRE